MTNTEVIRNNRGIGIRSTTPIYLSIYPGQTPDASPRPRMPPHYGGGLIVLGALANPFK